MLLSILNVVNNLNETQIDRRIHSVYLDAATTIASYVCQFACFVIDIDFVRLAKWLLVWYFKLVAQRETWLPVKYIFSYISNETATKTFQL